MGLPQPGNDYDDATTAESIDNIFRKYDQEYPFHGGNSDDGSNIQSDAPAVEAILERINGVMTKDRPNDFVVPKADSTKEQRSLLKKQYRELIFGPSRINRRVKEATNRANDENVAGVGGFVDFDQIGFFNKDSWTENYNAQVVDRLPGTTTRRTPIFTKTQTSRIPVRTSTRFPTRRTTTTEAPINPERETFIDLVEDEILEKPEGNKLSIPVLSVATEDFEEDLPQKPVAPMRPNKLTAQTDDFDASRSQLDNYRRQSAMFRKRRDTSSMEWLVNRVASFLNFYDEPKGAAEEGRKMSILSKRQITEDLVGDVIPPAIPIPEEVKSVDVPTQVADAVIETIQDIADPQTRNEFAKDVPAIEDKLDEIEEKEEVKQTVEVTVVELGQTEAESLGRIIEADPAGDALNVAIVGPEPTNSNDTKVETPKALELMDIPIEAAEEKKSVVETKVLRDQIPDDSSRSGVAPPAKIADIIAAIPSEMVSVMAPTETIRDIPESARKMDAVTNVAVVHEEYDDNDEKLSYIEVERVVPMIKSQKTAASNSEIASTLVITEVPVPQVPVKESVRSEIIPEVKAVEEPKASPSIPIVEVTHTTMLVEDKVVPEGDHESLAKKVILESDIVSGQSLSEIKSMVLESVSTKTNDTMDSRSATKVQVKEFEVAAEDPTFVISSVDIPVQLSTEKVSPVPQIKTPIVEQEQDFEIVIEPEAEDEPSPKSLNLNVTTAGPEETKIEATTPSIIVPLKEIKEHIVEETVLITENNIISSPDSAVKTVDDPNVPLISESVDTRLNSMIIAEVMEDENLAMGFNAGGEVPTTILPLDWLKEEFTGKEESAKSLSDSGSTSNSISTTESTSEWESKTTPLGSSEEIDSKEKDEAKILRKQEKKRLDEEKERKKALLGDQSSEEDHDEEKSPSHRVELIAKLVEPETRQKFTKEEMVNMFSSPEMDIDPRILETTAEVVSSKVEEAPKNNSSEHVVIKKDRVEIEEDDDSEESDEVTTLVIPEELMDKLAKELEQERETVEKALDVLQNAIEGVIDQDAAVETNLIDTGSELPQEMNTVISSKNTRHLGKMGYSEDEYVQRDIAMDGQEARLSNDFLDGVESDDHTSRAFLLGSALFLLIGFVLFALVVLIIKRTRRYGSMDLNIQA